MTYISENKDLKTDEWKNLWLWFQPSLVIHWSQVTFAGPNYKNAKFHLVWFATSLLNSLRKTVGVSVNAIYTMFSKKMTSQDDNAIVIKGFFFSHFKSQRRSFHVNLFCPLQQSYSIKCIVYSLLVQSDVLLLFLYDVLREN